MDLKHDIENFDDRRNIVIPGDAEATISFAVEHFIAVANQSIKKHGKFAVALSGGNTPKAIFKKLASPGYKDKIEWNKVLLFWSDERTVPPTDPESNYHMAMESGFAELPVPQEQIFRMKGEGDPEAYAKEYEELIKKWVPGGQFDLIMLGMGEDGHTASLFPKTHGLHTTTGHRYVIANFVPQKNTWRLSLTYKCINQAHHIVIYALGAGKAEMVKRVLDVKYDPDELPIQKVGTPEHKALWVLDDAAAKGLRDE